WGWHQLAIMTLAAAQEWDALDLRFPIVHRSDFDAAARRERVDASWLYAIARQESALDPGVRSPAGALGLMQVMPATAQLTARQAGIPYRGSSDLLDPARNVLIGSSYMRMMLDRFEQNRVLAAAAYNAGPGRIGQWLQRHPTDVDYDRFVETIPFRETRQYVQNVLSFAVIYAYLENRQMPLVQAHERVIHNPYAETRH
ncbi:MAG TPA: transglycosylase SLT domain-containing protein, partial [Pseudomonadales bacterium]|nr:transglycosylase SLT domain-containing protein [Pseudomonadales bacterium]